MKNVLSPEQIEQFERDGFVRVQAALPSEYVEGVRDFLWEYYSEAVGMLRDDPKTWQNVNVNKNVIDKAVRTQIGPRLIAATDQLLGPHQWHLSTLGGLLTGLPIHRIEDWKLRTDLWHTDNDPRPYLNDVTELMLFTFYSSVQARGGGTLVLTGSHHLMKLMKHHLDSYPNMRDFTKSHPYLRRLTNGRPMAPEEARQFMDTATEVYGVDVRVVEFTGEPGDAILCHRALFHAINMNCGSEPRMMRRTNIRRVKLRA